MHTSYEFLVSDILALVKLYFNILSSRSIYIEHNLFTYNILFVWFVHCLPYLSEINIFYCFTVTLSLRNSRWNFSLLTHSLYVGNHLLLLQIRSALYWKYNLCIPRNETARPCSQFLHSCCCEWFIYIFPGFVCLFGCSKIGKLILGIFKCSHIHDCGNWEAEYYNYVWEITRQRSFISGNTLIGTKHLFWILTGPHFQWVILILTISVNK